MEGISFNDGGENEVGREMVTQVICDVQDAGARTKDSCWCSSMDARKERLRKGSIITI